MMLVALGLIGLVLLGVMALVVLCLIAPAESERRAGAFFVPVRVMAWVFVAAGLSLLMVVLLLHLGCVLWIVAAVVIVASLQRTYRARQYAILDMMAVAAERQMPMTPVLTAFAQEQGGLMGQRVLGLLGRLEHGWPPSAAFAQSPGVVPPEALPAVCVGLESGRLAPALRRAVAARAADQPVWDALSGKLFYLWVLLCLAGGIVTFLMLKIVPAMERIFYDFETELPPLTQAMVLVCDALGGWVLLLAPLLLAGLAYVVLRYCGVPVPRVPGTSWLMRRRDTAAVLEALAPAAEAGRPLLGALATVAENFPAWTVRRRLRAAASHVAAGREWLDSLHAHGLLGQVELGVLRAAERAGNLPWAMTEMADSCRRRHAWRAQALLQVLFPVVILAVGMAVMLLVVGYFIPLITLIQRLTG